jgi:hypothetical protein
MSGSVPEYLRDACLNCFVWFDSMMMAGALADDDMRRLVGGAGPVMAAASLKGGCDMECPNMPVLQVRKRHFFRHLYIQCIILPRQARDKHRESTQKGRRFLVGRKTLLSFAMPFYT